MIGPLSDSTAIVTGASRGIGRAIALRLAEAGANVALWARDSNALRGVAAEITANAANVDLTSAAASLKTAAAAEASAGTAYHDAEREGFPKS